MGGSVRQSVCGTLVFALPLLDTTSFGRTYCLVYICSFLRPRLSPHVCTSTNPPISPSLSILNTQLSLSCVNNFLDEMAKEAKQIITNICVEQCDLSHQLRPKNCAAEIAQQVNKRRRENRPGRGEIGIVVMFGRKGFGRNGRRGSWLGARSLAVSGSRKWFWN